jgi:hypothetical protein
MDWADINVTLVSLTESWEHPLSTESPLGHSLLTASICSDLDLLIVYNCTGLAWPSPRQRNCVYTVEAGKDKSRLFSFNSLLVFKRLLGKLS